MFTCCIFVLFLGVFNLAAPNTHNALFLICDTCTVCVHTQLTLILRYIFNLNVEMLPFLVQIKMLMNFFSFCCCFVFITVLFICHLSHSVGLLLLDPIQHFGSL